MYYIYQVVIAHPMLSLYYYEEYQRTGVHHPSVIVFLKSLRVYPYHFGGGDDSSPPLLTTMKQTQKYCLVCGFEMPHHKERYCSDKCARTYPKLLKEAEEIVWLTRNKERRENESYRRWEDISKKKPCEGCDTGLAVNRFCTYDCYTSHVRKHPEKFNRGAKRKDFCLRGHKLEGDNVYYYENDKGLVHRVCKECKRIKDRERYKKHKKCTTTSSSSLDS